MPALTGRHTTELPEVPTVGANFALFGAVFFNRLAPLYLAGPIAEDLGASPSVEGTLALGIGLGWAAGMGLAWWSSGQWSDRRRVLVGATASAIVDGLSVLASSWALLVLLRGLGGMFSASTSPAVTSLTFRAAPMRRRGLDTGIVQSSSRIGGSLVAPVAITTVGAAFGWRAGLVTGALVLGVAAIGFALTVGPSDPKRPARRAGAKLVLRPGGRHDVAISALDCAMLLGWLTVVSQGGVPFLRDWLDVSTVQAGRLLAAFGVGASAGALLIPLWSDGIGRRKALVTAILLGGTSAMALGVLAAAGIRFTAGAVVALGAGGLAMGGLPLVISLIPAETVVRGDVGRALVVPVLAAEIVGGAIVPAMALALASTTGLAPVLVLMALLLAGAGGASSRVARGWSGAGRHGP